MMQRLKALLPDWPILKFIAANSGWLLVSLALAIIIWLVASLDENPVEQREFPESITIEFIQDRADTTLLSSTTLRRTARVTIRAPRNSWDELRQSDIEIHADLRDLEPGIHDVDLEGYIVDSGPPGRVVSVSPEDITVEIVPLETRTLELQILVFSELPAEYEYSEPQCESGTVTISGPGSLVQRVSSATVRLSLRTPGQAERHLERVIIRDNEGDEFSIRELDNLQIDPAQVECHVDVQRIENRDFLLVDVILEGTPPDGYALERWQANPEQVVVVGDPDLIASLGGVVQTTPIEITGQTSDFSRTVDLILPEGIQLRPEDTEVSVTVDIAPISTTMQFAEVPIRPVNLNPAFIASVVPQTVSITVQGPAPLIEDLTQEDLRVTVDLENYLEGTHTNLTPDVTLLREGLQDQVTVTVQPDALNVVISKPPTPTPDMPQPGSSSTPRLDIVGRAYVD
ncbi:MAG: hypothetical protein GYB66_09205 [Chloroflexi bacterium]|nr:hypothetical protein [Chloroflexota bacterium]